MLSYLKVRDYALIEDVEIEFHPGLNVLTGETGAGKTMLIGAIGLLLGDRADSMQVRRESDAARFSAVFDLAESPMSVSRLRELGYLDEGETELTLDRSVSSDGRSRCSVNGRISSVSALSEIAEAIVEVHGQNAHQALITPGTHLDYLDRYIGEAQLKKLDQYRERYAKLTALSEERRRMHSDGPDALREIDLLSHEVETITRACPSPGEIESMAEELERMAHSRELMDLAVDAGKALTGVSGNDKAARDLITQASIDLRKIAECDGSVREEAERLESIALEIEDSAAYIKRYLESLESDPAKMSEVESRLNLLRDLSRRFGGSLQAVIEYERDATERLERLSAMRRRAEVIDSEIEAEMEVVSGISAELAANRRKAAGSLEIAVLAELDQMELSDAIFEIEISENDAKTKDWTKRFGRSGSTQAEFLFSSACSETALPLKKIASGGEMSRVMLALKIVFADTDMLPVLIFDEVDSGIGGLTAGSVGEKLHRLAGYHQVFCVTHLPQIASFADWQYHVFKGVKGDRADTGVKLLSEEDRAEEICRMLGDSTGRKATKEHALDLLNRAAEKKAIERETV